MSVFLFLLMNCRSYLCSHDEVEFVSLADSFQWAIVALAGNMSARFFSDVPERDVSIQASNEQEEEDVLDSHNLSL